jgi:acetolactate synthase-1/2/3 large subunit
MDEAFHLAQSGRPGPVHISIPKDLQAKTSDAGSVRKPAAHQPGIDTAQVRKAMDLLAGARRPIILAGGGVMWARAETALTAFSERSGIPVIVTDTSRGAIPERHANALGPAGLFGSKAATDALKEADVVLGIGTRFPDLTTGNWEFIKSAAIIQNNIDPEEIGKRIPVAVGVPGDAAAFLAALSAALPPQRDIPARIRTLKDAVEAERAAFLTPPPGEHARIPIHLVVKEIAQVLEGKAILAIDGGLHTSFSGRLQINAPRSWLVSAGLGAMGYSLPAALGAKLAQPARDVVALVGDGGFAMVAQDLETAVRCNIPIVVVVYNNGAFGAQRLRQQRDYGGRMIGTSHGNPDYAAMARLYGAEGRSVKRIDEFRPALEALLACGRPGVIDVHIA